MERNNIEKNAFLQSDFSDLEDGMHLLCGARGGGAVTASLRDAPPISPS